LPSGRPRCDMSTTLVAPLSSTYLIVGSAATMLKQISKKFRKFHCLAYRWLFVILPSFIGTLKSTLKEKAHHCNNNCTHDAPYQYSLALHIQILVRQFIQRHSRFDGLDVDVILVFT
jgi:hypothetical protein